MAEALLASEMKPTYCPVLDFNFMNRDWSAKSQPSIEAMTWLAELVYREDDEIEAAMAPMGGEFFAFHANDVDVFVWIIGVNVLIAVRGSQMRWRDWLHNFAFWPVKAQWSRERVAHGIRLAVDAVMPLLRDRLARSDFTAITNLIITGHSKGGSECQGLAKALKREYSLAERQVCAYSCGSPRLWFGRGRSEFTHIRIVEERDLVPMVPPPLGFKHQGQTHLITDDRKHVDLGLNGSMSNLRIEQAIKLISARAGLVRIVRATWVIIRGIKGHKVGGYYAKVKGVKSHEIDDYG